MIVPATTEEKMTKPIPTISEIEKEFDKKYSVFDGSQKIIKHVTYSVWIKEFYRQQILAILEGLRGEEMTMTKEEKALATKVGCLERCEDQILFTNNAISDLNKKIDKIIKQG